MLVGVVIMQVKIPVDPDWTCWTLIPLVLSLVNNSTDLSGNPFGWVETSTDWIDVPVILTSKVPELMTSLVSELTITIVGALVNPSPTLTTLTLEIVFESLTVINGDISAWGLSVKSGEYTKLSVTLLVWFKFPIVFDNVDTIKSLPLTELVDFKVGNFLYPDPESKIWSSLTAPWAFSDAVLYSKVSHSVCT